MNGSVGFFCVCCDWAGVVKNTTQLSTMLIKVGVAIFLTAWVVRYVICVDSNTVNVPDDENIRLLRSQSLLTADNIPFIRSTNLHAHTFLDHDITSQSCGSCVVGLSVVMMSLIRNIKISSISIGSSDVQPSESPYLPVLFIGTSQSRQHDKSES
ncbi:hypothetical protein Tco_1355597, partial [Tanacetum coccineum]